MALGMGSLLRTFSRNLGLNSRIVKGMVPRRTGVTASSGSILPEPQKITFGLIRITLVVIPFLYVGTQISKNFAAVLEENDIFVPDDDDD